MSIYLLIFLSSPMLTCSATANRRGVHEDSCWPLAIGSSHSGRLCGALWEFGAQRRLPDRRNRLIAFPVHTAAGQRGHSSPTDQRRVSEAVTCSQFSCFFFVRVLCLFISFILPSLFAIHFIFFSTLPFISICLSLFKIFGFGVSFFNVYRGFRSVPCGRFGLCLFPRF